MTIFLGPMPARNASTTARRHRAWSVEFSAMKPLPVEIRL
jgi:hypothetical protein